MRSPLHYFVIYASRKKKTSLLSCEAALISVTYGRFLPSGCHADMKARLENLNIFDWMGNRAHMCTCEVCMHVASYSPAAVVLWSGYEMKRACFVRFLWADPASQQPPTNVHELRGREGRADAWPQRLAVTEIIGCGSTAGGW